MTEAEPKRETQIQTGETGRRLREARESKGQRVSDVAENLHLRPSIVSAIEEGDYRQIPGELFLKGYVKSYARLVGLSESEMLEALDRELEPLREADERARVEHPLEEIQRRKDSRRKTAKMVGLVVLVVAALVAYMEFSGRSSHMQMLGKGASSPADTAGAAPNGKAVTGAGATGSVPTSGEAATASGKGLETTAPQTPATSAQVVSGQRQTSQPEALPAGQSAASGEDTAAKGAASVAVANGEKSAAGAAAIAREPTLKATFTGDCWVEVTNGDGVKVVAALKQAGDSLEYRGPAPFHVVLGAVSQVGQITYNGTPVKLSQYPSPGNRAEFVLGSKHD